MNTYAFKSMFVLAVLWSATGCGGSGDHDVAVITGALKFPEPLPSYSGCGGWRSCTSAGTSNCSGVSGCSLRSYGGGSPSCEGQAVSCQNFDNWLACEAEHGCDWSTWECNNHSDCEAPRYCQNWTCVDPECGDDNDCRGGEVCIGSRSNAHCADCRSDGDCSGDDYCANETCREPQCVSDAGCPGSQVCIGSGRQAYCAECHSDGDCAGAAYCVNETCREPVCAEHSDCPRMHVCIGSRDHARCMDCRIAGKCSQLQNPNPVPLPPQPLGHQVLGAVRKPIPLSR